MLESCSQYGNYFIFVRLCKIPLYFRHFNHSGYNFFTSLNILYFIAIVYFQPINPLLTDEIKTLWHAPGFVKLNLWQIYLDNLSARRVSFDCAVSLHCDLVHTPSWVPFTQRHNRSRLDIELEKQYYFAYDVTQPIQTFSRRPLFLAYKIISFLNVLKMSKTFSRFIEPIPGMFVLVWMYFSWWFQIWSQNSVILTFFTKFVYFLTCRLHSPPRGMW